MTSIAPSSQERAAIVGLITGSTHRRLESERSLDELAGLAEAAGGRVALRMAQERPRPDPSTYLGSGKLNELAAACAEADIDLENQGVKATSISYNKAPNKAASETTFIAVGKKIASGWEFFDGTTGEEVYSFSPLEKLAGKRLEDAKLGADFYSNLDWKSKYKAINVLRIAKVGLEDAYAVEFEPEKGTKFTEYYSTTTFRLLKREGSIASSTSAQTTPYTVTYKDYRVVDGVLLPFLVVNNTASNGDVVTTFKSIKHNVQIDDKLFAHRTL